MSSSINLSDRKELQKFYIGCITLQLCLLALGDQMKDDHINQHLIDDESFRIDIQNLAEEHSKQFADYLQHKYRGQHFIYRRTICDQGLINEFLDKKFKELKKWEEYKESRPDLFD